MSLSLLISTIEKEVDKTEKKIIEITTKSNSISKIYIDI